LKGTADTLDQRVFRQTMGCFATGVAVVSCKRGEELFGMTVNSLTSVSLAPPLVLVCFNRGARTEHAVREAGIFGVSFLREDQSELSNRFARNAEDHYAGVAVGYEDGVPLLAESLAHLVCRVANVYDEGDHSIVLASVLRAAAGAGAPLLFFRGKYHALGGTAGRAEHWYW
jgi:flavin reductase (DIM6/NTAB) family NADH-FMN oxidoreductase RutF